MQTSEQVNEFRKLCEANGLGKSDVWQHKQSGNWIMSRTGAEKVQGRNNIQIEIEVCAAALDYAIVKATASRTVKAEGAKTAKKLSIQTLGSANPKNCTQISYYAEMAEKRAKVRAVLMLMGFYELGVYGEEEAEDFARAKNPSGPTLEDAPAPVVLPGKSKIEVVGPVLVTPAVSAAPAPSGDESASAALKEEIIRLLNHPVMSRPEKTAVMLNLGRITAAKGEQEKARLLALIAQREAERSGSDLTEAVIGKAQAMDLLRSAESHVQLDAFWKEEVAAVWGLDVDVLAAAKATRQRLNQELQDAA